MKVSEIFRLFDLRKRELAHETTQIEREVTYSPVTYSADNAPRIIKVRASDGMTTEDSLG